MLFDELRQMFKEAIGVDPSNLNRRFLVGSIIIMVVGFLSFGAIFYSFLSAFNTTSQLCRLPEEVTDIMSTYFTFPLIIVGLYMSLVAAIIYFVNPWERLK